MLGSATCPRAGGRSHVCDAPGTENETRPKRMSLTMPSGDALQQPQGCFVGPRIGAVHPGEPRQKITASSIVARISGASAACLPRGSTGTVPSSAGSAPTIRGVCVWSLLISWLRSRLLAYPGGLRDVVGRECYMSYFYFHYPLAVAVTDVR